MARRYVVFYGSEWLRGRQYRRRAKQAMQQGKEPQPRYSTGKFWTD